MRGSTLRRCPPRNITRNDHRTRLSPRALCLATFDQGLEPVCNEPCETNPWLRSNCTTPNKIRRNGRMSWSLHHQGVLPVLTPAPSQPLQRGLQKPQRRTTCCHSAARTARAASATPRLPQHADGPCPTDLGTRPRSAATQYATAPP